MVYDLDEENIDREERPLASSADEHSSRGVIIYMQSTVESSYPTVRATELLMGDPLETLRSFV